MKLILTAGALCATLFIATIAAVHAQTLTSITDDTNTPIEVVGE